jgi:hypothetical protein
VGQLGAAVSNDNGDDIEPDVDGAGTPLTQPCGREASQTRLLGVPHSFGGHAPAIVLPGLHLTENDEIRASDNEIDLSGAATPEVPLDDREAMTAIPASRRIFAPAAEARS